MFNTLHLYTDNDNKILILMTNLLLFHYNLNKGKRIKQVYFIGDEAININGTNEEGRELFLYPEGNKSNEVISMSDLKTLFSGIPEVQTNRADIYLLN